MKWYLAKLVFRIICGEGNHTPQFDEQFVLFMQKMKCMLFRKQGYWAIAKKITF